MASNLHERMGGGLDPESSAPHETYSLERLREFTIAKGVYDYIRRIARQYAELNPKNPEAVGLKQEIQSMGYPVIFYDDSYVKYLDGGGIQLPNDGLATVVLVLSDGSEQRVKASIMIDGRFNVGNGTGTLAATLGTGNRCWGDVVEELPGHVDPSIVQKMS